MLYSIYESWTMARTPLPEDRKELQLTVKTSVENRKFLQELAEEMPGSGYVAEVVREIFESLRTLCGLPEYQASRLRKEMAAKKLHVLNYLKELLAKRYEELKREDEHAAPSRGTDKSSKR